jgi:L-lactate dehydrogenase complex protein LldF
MTRPDTRTFDAIVRATVDDEGLQRWLADYQILAQESHNRALDELGDTEAWRDAVAAVRRHTLAHLDRYLAQFADNVERNGGRVFFAATANEARDHIVELARRRGVRRSRPWAPRLPRPISASSSSS